MRVCGSSRAAGLGRRRDAHSVVALRENEDVDDPTDLRAWRATYLGIAQHQGRGCGGARVEGGPTTARLADARQGCPKAFLRLCPQTASEVAQLRVDPTGFDHRPQQRRIRSRENSGDLPGDVVFAVGRDGVESAHAEVVLLAHQVPHQIGLVRELVVEGADPDARRAADLVNARAIANLAKEGPRRGQEPCALLGRVSLSGLGRFVRQITQCALTERTPQPSVCPHTVGVRTNRLEAFSDGVFAIAATLLVLELRVPPESPDLVGELLHLWPAYAAYFVSFLTIGIIWVNHHTLLEHCKRVDRRFLYLNLLLLIAVGIVPFPTSLVDQYILSERGATAALVVYGLGAVLIAIAFTAVFLYATHDHRLVGDRPAARRIRAEGRLFPIGLVAYSLGIVLAFIEPKASLAVYGLTAIFYALPLLPLPSR